MTARQLTLEDCQAVSDLEKQLFHGRFDSTTLRALLVKPTFYGVVLPAPDMPKTIHAYCLAYITSMQADIIALGTDKTKQGQGFGRIILQYLIDVTEQQNVLEDGFIIRLGFMCLASVKITIIAVKIDVMR
jgi:GNAT superfamily N-acetyltransferase